MRQPAILILLGACLLLSACGQRGPLYLPDQAPDQSPAQAEQEQGRKTES